MIDIKTDRIRCDAHLAFVRRQPCCVPGCRNSPVRAHHLMCSPESKARSLKAGDNWTIPACDFHHNKGGRQSIHGSGDERAWWAAKRIDPIALAERLWAAGPGPRLVS